MPKRPLHIRVISPSGAVDATAIEQAQLALQQRGFDVSLGQSVFAQHRYLAGTIQQRVQDFITAYRDPRVDAIWCGRGGSGAGQLLPYLDTFYLNDHFKQKPLIGYSDNTCLLNYIQQRHGLAMHAPVFQEICQKNLDPQIEQHQYIPISKNALQVLDLIQQPLEPKHYTLKPIYMPTQLPIDLPIQGQLIGGNLTTLCSLQGTPYAIKANQPSILILEDIGEVYYRLERLWVQLLQSLNLKNIKAIILGEFYQCPQHQVEQHFSDIFAEYLKNTDIPLYQVDFMGHGKDNQPFYLGKMAQIQQQTLFI